MQAQYKPLSLGDRLMNIWRVIFYILAIATIVALACGAGYLGLWVMFVGGIIQIIEGAKATPVESMEIALGILRFVMTGVVTWIAIIFASVVSGAILGLAPRKRTEKFLGYK